MRPSTHILDMFIPSAPFALSDVMRIRDFSLFLLILFIPCLFSLAAESSQCASIFLHFVLFLFKVCHMNSDIFMLIAVFSCEHGGTFATGLFVHSRRAKYFNYALIRRRTITVISESTSTFLLNKAIIMHKILFADWTGMAFCAIQQPIKGLKQCNGT